MAEAQRTEFEHDPNGNRTVLRDALGNETAWVYDALNRPTSETILLGTGAGAYEATRSWQYDKLNAVVAYIDHISGLQGLIAKILRLQWTPWGRIVQPTWQIQTIHT